MPAHPHPQHPQQPQQQHLEHYPGPPSYYAGYSPGGGAAGGQCYPRGLQAPYMGKEKYGSALQSRVSELESLGDLFF